MMMDLSRNFTKAQLLQVLSTLPDMFTIEQLYAQLVFVSNINEASQKVGRGETYTTEEARERMRQM